MKKPLERDVLKQCLEYLQLKRCYCWRANSGAMTATYKGKSRFVRFNGMPGCADIVGLMPHPEFGRFIAVEVKRPGGKLSDQQAEFLERVRAHGGVALCVRSVDELIEALGEYL